MFFAPCQLMPQHTLDSAVTMGRTNSSAHSGAMRGYERAPLRCGVSSMLLLTVKARRQIAAQKTLPGSNDCLLRITGGPGAGDLLWQQPIVTPAVALRTNKATVLNHFRFRQTQLVTRATAGENTTPFDLDQ